MERYKHIIILLSFLGFSLGSCFSQTHDYWFRFVSQQIRDSIFNKQEMGNNWSFLTNINFKKPENALKVKDQIRGVALTNLKEINIDGTLLANFKNLEILFISIDEKYYLGTYPKLNELGAFNQNLNKIAVGIRNLKKLKYVLVVGSNDSLNNALSGLDSLKSLMIFNMSDSFLGEGNWKSLNFLSYTSKSGNLNLSKMSKLDSLFISVSEQSNVFSTLPENSIKKIIFSGDPSKLDYSVFNPKTLKTLILGLSNQSVPQTKTLELNLVNLNSLKELEVEITEPIIWGKIDLSNLEKLKLVKYGDIKSIDCSKSEFPTFIKSLTKLKSLELDLYTDYIPKKSDFPKTLTHIKLRFSRNSYHKKINFLKKITDLEYLALDLFPLNLDENQCNVLELKGDFWLTRLNHKIALELKNGAELKHFEKIIKSHQISKLTLESLQVKKNLEAICSSEFESIRFYPSKSLNSENVFEIVSLTDQELGRLMQCQGEVLNK